MLASAKNNTTLLTKLFFLSSIIVILTACSSENNVDKTPAILGNIVDNEEWYAQIDPNTTIDMQISVPTPNDLECAPYNDPNATLRPCTLEDVEGDDDPYDDYKPAVHVLLDSIEFSSNNRANAVMEQKGKSTRQADQDSFRVKLDSQTNLYNKERTFQFNKHAYDETRMKNKLFFDMFIGVPNFTSLRTRFVNLFVNGNDYGLFTHIEYCDEQFLINRGWREDDNIYKAQNFSFRENLPDMALDSKDEPLHPDLFDAVIESKSGSDYNKLIEMLRAIDSSYRDPVKFEPVFNKYFNRENYITWLAINIIVSNKDTVTQNFYLLNPQYSDTFYFLPWDYDGAGYPLDRLAKWEHGFGFWWNVPLHRGFLSIAKNREDLNAKIEYLRANYLTDQRFEAKIEAYKPIVEHYISMLPDSDDLDYDEWNTSVHQIVNQVRENITAYYGELGSPMPFWQAVTYNSDTTTLELSWSKSIDLEGDPIVYDLKISKNMDMSDPIVDVTEIADNPATTGDTNLYYDVDNSAGIFSAGTYYMQVIAREENNASSYQYAFDTEFEYVGLFRKNFFGVLSFDIQ